VTVISTFEELIENEDFQKAMAVVLPRMSAYLSGVVLLRQASNKSMSAEDKGMYLEAFNDVIVEMTKLYRGDTINPPAPTTRERPKLRNSHFNQ
jgi:hypothetical protein